MAYFCVIASVPVGQVHEIRGPSDVSRLASKINLASHYIAQACAPVTEAMDGGSVIETDTWHPVRGFKVHSPAEVSRITAELTAFDHEMSSPDHKFHNDDFFREEFVKVLQLFQHASNLGEAIVNSLDLNRSKRAAT